MTQRLFLLVCCCLFTALAQKRDHGTVAAPGSIQDMSEAAVTRPFQVGTSLPASCSIGQAFFKTDEIAGQNLHLCTSTNTWTKVSAGSGTGGYFREVNYPPVVNQSGTSDLASGWNTPGADGATRGNGGIAPHTYGFLAFSDGATPLYAVLNARIPTDWDAGSVQATVLWNRNSATGTAVALRLESACVAAGGNYVTPSYGSAQIMTPAVPATVDTVAITTWSSLNLSSCAAGNLLALRLSRDPSHPSDDFSGQVRVINFTLRFPVR